MTRTLPRGPPHTSSPTRWRRCMRAALAFGRCSSRPRLTCCGSSNGRIRKLIEPEILAPEEMKLLLETYDQDTYEDVRDRALLAMLAATGLRYNAVLTMRTQNYDRVTGEFKV